MSQLLRVVVYPDAHARVDGGYVLGDRLGQRILAGKPRMAAGNARARNRRPAACAGTAPTGAKVRRETVGPRRMLPATISRAQRTGRSTSIQSARAHVIDVPAQDAVDTRDRVGRAVRERHVLRPFQHTAQQKRAHRAAASIGCDDAVRAADPADRAAVHAYPPCLDAGEPDDLPALLRDEGRQLLVGPRVIEHEPDESALVEVPPFHVRAKEGDHRRHVAQRERADLRRHAREPISA